MRRHTFSLRTLFSSWSFITSPLIWPNSAFFFSLHFFADLRFCINLTGITIVREFELLNEMIVGAYLLWRLSPSSPSLIPSSSSSSLSSSLSSLEDSVSALSLSREIVSVGRLFLPTRSSCKEVDYPLSTVWESRDWSSPLGRLTTT